MYVSSKRVTRSRLFQRKTASAVNKQTIEHIKTFSVIY